MISRLITQSTSKTSKRKRGDQLVGRGSSGIGSGGWKSQLKAYAKRGEMPGSIIGDRKQQAEVLEEINRLYSMPDTNAKITDIGSGVQVEIDGKTYRSNYPSGEAASEEEKQGALKMLLYNKQKVKGK